MLKRELCSPRNKKKGEGKQKREKSRKWEQLTLCYTSRTWVQVFHTELISCSSLLVIQQPYHALLLQGCVTQSFGTFNTVKNVLTTIRHIIRKPVWHIPGFFCVCRWKFKKCSGGQEFTLRSRLTLEKPFGPSLRTEVCWRFGQTCDLTFKLLNCTCMLAALLVGLDWAHTF